MSVPSSSSDKKLQILHSDGVPVRSSSVALALVAASLVRSTGYALGNASAEAVQGAVALLLTAALTGFFLIFVVAGG